MKDNVLRGIELLDQKAPDWRKKIDWDRLYMKSCERCILGQVFGNFVIGQAELDLPDQDAIEMYGFDTDQYTYHFDLAELWREESLAPGG